MLVRELIPIESSDSCKQLVDARMLHGFLGVGRDFSNWVKFRIDQYEFIKGSDYIVFTPDPAENQR